MEFLVGLQEWIRAAVSDQLDSFETTRSFAVLVAMLPLGIAFGAVHALTPGHGKTVLASYVVGSRLGVLRSVGVAGVLSATHVASAVLLALVGSSLLSRTITGAGRSDLIEDVSRALIALIGLWLVVRAIRGARHVHGEGAMVGFAAGLIPCPLTLFAMVLAIALGIPEAGIAFAVSMLIGIALTLSAVAAATVLARDLTASRYPLSGDSGDTVASDLVVQFVAGAFMALLTGWLDTGAKAPPARMDDAFRRLTTKGIVALLPPTNDRSAAPSRS